ncbi:hypothetical protein EW145_g2986 [Phellinidium pouzarii]|uniref:Uncharacterized protein n=1 Tax=Phellinidium pouzarii TaxID=167371 RepID=A0A4S4L8S7_9AGAM|nr:hypothetical protein EW145_g2986 [Phellinidium pouzarii]
MHPSLRVCSARVHTPLIHFIGKRQWPAKPEPPHAHPAGPAEYKAHFSDFLKKFQYSRSQSVAPKKAEDDGHDVYQEFWQAPVRLWNPRVRELSEEEMEAVLSGGASLR